jgi:hypothetical protein
VSEGRPNFEGVYGAVTDPLRLVYMMGLVWRLAQDGKRPLDVLEVGSWCGASALTWGEAMDLYSGGGRIVCLDAWQPFFAPSVEGLAQAMDQALASGEVERVFRDNMRFQPASVRWEAEKGLSDEMLSTLPSESFDIVYLDGDHSYDAVVRDIEQSIPLLRDGGILCGDDFDPEHHEGVVRAVTERFGSVSEWHGLWAMRKAGGGWESVSLGGMPMRIPSHLPVKSLMGLKAALMRDGLL